MKSWIVAVVGVIVLGGALYYVMQQYQTVTPQDAVVSEKTDRLEERFKKDETDFLAETQMRDGVLTVRFVAQVIREDGADYEAAVLFGDGREDTVAHWSPTLFNEEMNHQYDNPGSYTASLVLIPKALLTEDVLERRTKIQDLKGTIVIKTIGVNVRSATDIAIQN